MKNNGINMKKLLDVIGVTKESTFVDRKMLYEGMARLGLNPQAESVSDVVEELLDGRDFIELDQLISVIDIHQSKKLFLYKGFSIFFSR